MFNQSQTEEIRNIIKDYLAHGMTGDITLNGKLLISIYELNGSDYTILDNDGYAEIWVTTGSSNRTITLPTLSANLKRKIKIIKIDSGTGDVIIDGESSETINSTLTINITEQYGWWVITAGATEWNGETDGFSTILEVSSTTADTGLSLNNTWDDVTDMALTITPGKWLVSSRSLQIGSDSSYPEWIELYFGLGTTAGNNAPNISGLALGDEYMQTIPNSLYGITISRIIKDELYVVSANTTIYMKAKINTSELNASGHYMMGGTNFPMYIRARRIA